MKTVEMSARKEQNEKEEGGEGGGIRLAAEADASDVADFESEKLRGSSSLQHFKHCILDFGNAFYELGRPWRASERTRICG